MGPAEPGGPRIGGLDAGGPEAGGSEAGGSEAAGVGAIGGLRPRHRPGDGGDVPAADVGLVEALAPRVRRTVAAWLLDGPSPATRQTRLQVLAAFLRWLHAVEPDLDPLAVTGAHLDAYCAGALAGTLTIGVRTPGRPLAPATVARKRAVLSSFYTHAWRSGAVRHDSVPGETRTLTREDRRQLRRGIARLAADGRPAEAAAVALLEATGATADALAGLTLQDLRAVNAGEPAIVTVHDGRGDLVAFPVPEPVRPLLRALSSARTPGEPLLRRADGQAVDVRWLRAALTDAALAGGMPRARAELLDPYLMRATTVTELLRGRAT
ncbi:hypothetical protein [Nonomuraea sp. NPDC049709]|uniref:hypothetical protein n=1 Tax=Nonomuraea sp. NPDC049709 TaxID=3154736 RepID=UPI00343885F1